MGTLRYTIIKTEKQYKNYCDVLEEMIQKVDSAYEDEIELLTLLIEKWDNDHNSFSDLNPVELLKSLMEENNLKAADLTRILRLSKETIRKLSQYFQVSQEAFNRPYKLKNEVNRQYRDAG